MRRRELTRLALALVLSVPAASRADSGVEAELALEQPLRLDDCVRIALEKNLDLRVARTDLGAARSSTAEAAGLYWPVLTVTGEGSNFRNYGEMPDRVQYLRTGTALLSQTLPPGTLVEYSFGVVHDRLDPDYSDTPGHVIHFGITQPLLRGGGWRAGSADLRATRADERISENNVHGTELGVVQQVKTAYFEVIRQSKLIEVNAKAVQRDSQLVRQSQSKLDAGMGTKRDVLSAEIILEQDRGKLVDATTACEQAADDLLRVMGLQPGSRLQVAEKDVEMVPVQPDEAGWTAKALRDNPTVRAARLAVDRAGLDVQVAANGRLPQLDLGLNWNRTDDPDLNEQRKILNVQRALEGKEPKDLSWTAQKGWTALVTLSYPLGNRGPAAAYKRSRILLEQSRRNLEDAEKQVRLDIRSGIRNLQNSVERLAILNKNIEGARNKLEFASINFQLGRASNLDITEAQKDLLEAETDYINEVIDYRVQLANIESLVGGYE